MGYSRHCPRVARAARAVASSRDDSLGEAIADSAAYRRDFDITHPSWNPE